MTEQKLVNLQSVAEVKKKGWKVGFFVDGEPGGMVLKSARGEITADGRQVHYTDTIKLGIYKRAENPFREIRSPFKKKRKLKVRFTGEM